MPTQEEQIMKYQNLEMTLHDATEKGILLPIEQIEILENMQNRKVYIIDEIDQCLMDSIQMTIQDANEEDEGVAIEDRKPIRIYIDSYGGALYPTLATLDFIRMSKTPVWTICKGVAYSSAGLLLLAGHKRFCYKNSSFLLHSGNNGYVGKTDSVFDNIEFDKRVVEKLVKEHVVDRSKISAKDYDKNYRREWFMSSSEMLEHGIVDEISNEII